jgi:hypothetical protein
MEFKQAIQTIQDTFSRQSFVTVEYVTHDASRKRGGELRKFIGFKAGSSHSTKENGTLVLVNNANERATIHVALIMQVNNQRVF